MGTKAWGKHFWYTLHFIALGYPKDPESSDIQRFKEFFENFHFVIPCKRCSKNYLLHLNELPIDPYLSNTKLLFEWTVKLHNIVNAELGKKQWTIEEAYQHYTKLLEHDISDVSRSGTKPINNTSHILDLNTLFVTFLCFITFIFIAYALSKKRL